MTTLAPPPTTRFRDAPPEPRTAPLVARRLPEPPAVATTAVDGFRRDVQGLRGIAVLLVVCFHAGLGLTGGFIGVDVFFVVSGFVITLGLARELRTTGTISFRNFYTRRIRRLLPIFAVVSGTTILLSLVAIPGLVARQALADTARSASLLMANLQLESTGGGYFAESAENNPFLHTWSLSVEEQFYLVLPALLLVTWRVGRGPATSARWCRFTVAFLTATSFLAATSTIAGGDVRTAFYATPLRAWEFGVGVLLALNVHHLARLRRTAASLLSLIGLVALLVPALLYTEATTFPGVAALAPVLGTALLIVGGSAAGPVTSAVSWSPLTWIGDRSYGWYLWHWPGIILAEVTWPDAPLAAPAAAVCTLLITAVTYRLVEHPMRRAHAVKGIAVVALAGILVLVPVAASSIVDREAVLASEPVGDDFGLFSRAWEANCTNLPWPEEDCVFPVDDASGTALLLGDSHAAAMADVVTTTAARLQLDTVVSTMFGCPAFPRGVLDGGLDGGDSCLRYQNHVLDLIDRYEPRIVVVQHRSGLYVDPARGHPLLDRSGQPVTSTEEGLTEWGAAAGEFFAAIDVPVLLLASGPEFPETMTDHVAAGRTDHPDNRMARAQVETRRAPVLEREIGAAAADGDVLVADPVPTLCGDHQCSAVADGRFRYHDGHHLRAYTTADFAGVLHDSFVQLLRGLPSADNT